MEGWPGRGRLTDPPAVLRLEVADTDEIGPRADRELRARRGPAAA